MGGATEQARRREEAKRHNGNDFLHTHSPPCRIALGPARGVSQVFARRFLPSITHHRAKSNFDSKRLEKDGFITSYWGDEMQGARRKYYHITDKGRELYRQNLLNWDFTLKILSNLLKEEK
ncbi:MAG: PadR family transcriptional regulator [Gracilibacteraceae bacterium]|nr:PadR family transcriptional regulator [Gracilibacteraceae bacterium]